jgi:hypothetical protein
MNRTEMLTRLAQDYEADAESFVDEELYMDCRHLVLTGQAIYENGEVLMTRDGNYATYH